MKEYEDVVVELVGADPEPEAALLDAALFWCWTNFNIYE